MANLVTLLSGYPLWAGEQAVEAVKKTSKFIPTHAELYEELDDRTKPFRYAAEWERGAQQLLDQRALPAPDAGPKPTYEELRAKYDGPNGEKWGISNPDRPWVARQTPAKARAELIAVIGQDAFDAIPDAPKDMKQLMD